MKKIPFVKMHWTWNDFIIINQDDLDRLNIALNSDFVKKICDRNYWIWSDWILVITVWDKSNWYNYVMYNPDFSRPEMCWNWIRCYMKYLVNNSLIEWDSVNVWTDIWTLNLKIKNDDVIVDMWKPSKINDFNFSNKNLWEKFALKSKWRDFVFMPVRMWNPHAVIFLQDESLETFDLHLYGYDIENKLDIFPNRVNVEFIKVLSDKEIDMRVWERWAWETLACWTWACASVVAWILSWRLSINSFIKVNLKWWNLWVKWSWEEKDSVIMKWWAETTFEWNYFVKE